MKARSYEAKLRRLFRAQDKLDRAHAEDIRKAKEDGKSVYEIDELNTDVSFEWHLLDVDIAVLATEHLCRKAKRRMLPLPSLKDNEMWENLPYASRPTLTGQGISQVRASLREETKARRELVVPIGTLVVGFLGVVTGLVAVIIR